MINKKMPDFMPPVVTSRQSRAGQRVINMVPINAWRLFTCCGLRWAYKKT
jgi:hypothetical protein